MWVIRLYFAAARSTPKRARVDSYFIDPFLNRFPIKTLERITPPVTRESPLFGAVVRISSSNDAVFVFVRFFFTENRPRKASAADANEDVYEDELWI